MKKTKVIIPALGILLLSTAASVTGTVAWFSMNTNVSATGMNIKAQAENGILISNEAKALWKDTATASHSGANVKIVPTSTADGTTWYHAKSVDADDYHQTGGYTTLTGIAKDENGVGVLSGINYYLENDFYIKSSGEAMNNSDFYVNVVSGSGVGTGVNALLAQSLRVLIKCGSDTLIFAPFRANAEEISYNVAGATSATTAQGSATNPKVNVKFPTAVNIPVVDTNAPIGIAVYIYFEGEDEECKSANLSSTLDTLGLELQFGTKTVA